MRKAAQVARLKIKALGAAHGGFIVEDDVVIMLVAGPEPAPQSSIVIADLVPGLSPGPSSGAVG